MDKATDKVRDLLPKEYDDIDARIRERVEQAPEYAKGGIPGFLWSEIGDEATREIADAMDTSVWALFAKGWCKTDLVRKSARESHDTGKPVTLTLGKHKATARITCDVEVRVDPLASHTIPFELELTALFKPVRLRIERGAITKIWSGECSIESVLKMAGEALHEAKKSPSVVLGAPLEFAAPGLVVVESQERVL